MTSSTRAPRSPRMDGAVFAGGSTVSAVGWHTLEIHAADLAGNRVLRVLGRRS